MKDAAARKPQRPLAFWAMVALATGAGLGAAARLWLKAMAL
jgi:hypothetical protein